MEVRQAEQDAALPRADGPDLQGWPSRWSSRRGSMRGSASSRPNCGRGSTTRDRCGGWADGAPSIKVGRQGRLGCAGPR